MRGKFLAGCQQVDGTPVIGLRSNSRIQSWHRFNVVIKDFQAGFQYRLERCPVTGQVRNQHFHTHSRAFPANGPNGPGDVFGATIGQVVASYHGQNAKRNTHSGHRSGCAKRLRRIGWLHRVFFNSAESTAAGAIRTQQQKSRVALAEAFHLVGAFGLGTDRMHGPFLDGCQDFSIEACSGDLFSKPGRFRR